MALDLPTLEGHLSRIISDIPVAFTWDGTTYEGAKSSPDLSSTLELGGVIYNIEFNLFVRASVLPSVPQPLKTIFTIEGVKMKVVTLRKSPDGGQLLTFGMAYARQE